MAGFKLSGDINSEKIFLINRSEIEGRLDARYNFAKSTNIIESQHPIKKIKDICVVSMTGGTPSKANSDYWNGSIPWASPKDVKERYISETQDYITEIALERSSTKLIPVNSLIIVFRGIQGKFNTAINKQPIAINQDLKALLFKDNINPEYISCFFSVFQTVVFPLITKQSTTVESINTEQFDNLGIPIPPINIQNHILDIYNTAYSHKQQKEAEAQQLLDSIDGYLLRELGIELPEVDNSLESRIFQVQYSDITSRFDAQYYKGRIDHPSFVKLSEFASVKGGKRIPKGLSYSQEDTQYKYLRVTDLSDNLDVYKLKSIDESIYSLLERYKINDGDIAFSIAGTIGKAIIMKSTPTDYNVILTENCAKIVIHDSERIHDIYLVEILNSSTVQTQVGINYIQTTIPKLGLDRISELKIPIPPLEKQKAIAAYIQGIRNKARQLQEEAQQILEQAKQEVERMILGEK